MAVITKDSGGKLSVKERPDELAGTAVGSLVGALVGILGGPAGVIVGMTAGMLLGSISDLLNIGVGTDFLDKVSRDLAPGKAAVIAEIDEDWVTPLNTRMEAIGASVEREWRSDFEEVQIEKETAASKAELAQLKAEMAQSARRQKQSSRKGSMRSRRSSTNWPTRHRRSCKSSKRHQRQNQRAE